MIIPPNVLSNEQYEKAFDSYLKKLYGIGQNNKELARPGPKSAAQTPAPTKERIKGSKENPKGTAATRADGDLL